MMKGLGKGVRSFKEGMNGLETDADEKKAATTQEAAKKDDDKA